MSEDPVSYLPDSLGDLLSQSEALYADIERTLCGFAMKEPDARELVSLMLCQVAFEHGVALRGLLANQLITSGIALLRIQFEALIRAAWLLHAATDGQVARMAAPLTPEAEKGAKGLPSIQKMIQALEQRGPAGAGRMLRRFHDRLAEGLNSFVHSGIHPVYRQVATYPSSVLCDVVRNSNAVAMLTVIVIGELSDEGTLFIARYRDLNRQHGAALPADEPFAEESAPVASR